MVQVVKTHGSFSNTANAEACCLAPDHNTQETCPPSGSGSYGYFSAYTLYIGCFDSRLTGCTTEQFCPNAYAYAYDESSQSALWTCNATLQADYTITFCPPS